MGSDISIEDNEISLDDIPRGLLSTVRAVPVRWMGRFDMIEFVFEEPEQKPKVEYECYYRKDSPGLTLADLGDDVLSMVGGFCDGSDREKMGRSCKRMWNWYEEDRRSRRAKERWEEVREEENWMEEGLELLFPPD